ELKARRIPALLFVTTRFVAGEITFYWDWLADCLQHRGNGSLELPLVGRVVLSAGAPRKEAKRAFVAAAKQLSDSERLEAIRSAAAVLGVDMPGPPARSLHLDWNDIKELQRYGFSIGGHTVNHPILSRVS